MDAPEELQWAVAEALFDASDDLRPEDNWPDDDAKYGRAAAAVLAVPVVRDALARDAQVREIAKTWTDRLNGNDPWPTTVTIEAMASIAALYPSPGDRDDSKEQR